MLCSSDKTYSKTSKFGLYKYDQYEDENKEGKNLIKTILVTGFIIFILFLALGSLYYLPKEDNNQMTQPSKDNNFTKNETISKLTQPSILKIENATALPFFSSLFSNYLDEDSHQLKRKIISNDKQYVYDASKIDKYPYKYEKRGQDLLALYDEQRENEQYLDYRGIKLKGIYRRPETDAYGTAANEYGYKTLTYERLPLDPFYRYKPQTPGDVNMLAPNTYRFSPSLYKKKDDKQSKPVSVMLDIYPMSQEDGIGDKTSIISLLTNPILQATIPVNNKINKVPDTTPYPYEKVIVTTEPITSISKNSKESESPNKMIVHLNLYPRKRQRHHKRKPVNRHSVYNINPGYLMRNRYKINNDYGNHLRNEEYPDYENEYDEYYDVMPQINRKHQRDRKMDTKEIKYDISNVDIQNAEITESKIGKMKSSRNQSHKIASKGHIKLSKPHSTTHGDYDKHQQDIGVRNSSEMDVLYQQMPKISFIQNPPQIQHKVEYVAMPISDEILEEHLQRIGMKNFSEVQKKPGMSISVIPPQILHNKYLTTPSSSLHWDLNQLKEAGKLPNHRSENTF